MALRIGQRRVEPFRMDFSATVAHKTGFNAVLRFQPLSKVLQGLVQTRILRLQQLGQIASVQRWLRRPAHELHGTLRAMQQAQFLVHLQHGQGAVVHVRGQPLVGDPQCVHGDLQLMHVNGTGDEANDFAPGIAGRCQADGAPFFRTIRVVQQALVFDALTRQHPLDKRHETHAVGSAVELDQRFADHLIRCGGEPACVFGIAVNHLQIAIDQRHRPPGIARDHVQHNAVRKSQGHRTGRRKG